jgi:hypothetical protein
MKKILAVALLSLITSSGFADPIGPTEIPQYTTALRLALAKSPTMKCAGSQDMTPEEVVAWINGFRKGEVKRNGEQPVLVFTAESGNRTDTASVTTNADDQTIKSMQYIAIQCSDFYKEVNKGSISEPKIEKLNGRDCATVISVTCE